jgi:hypothetical protein
MVGISKLSEPVRRQNGTDWNRPTIILNVYERCHTKSPFRLEHLYRPTYIFYGFLNLDWFSFTSTYIKIISPTLINSLGYFEILEIVRLAGQHWIGIYVYIYIYIFECRTESDRWPERVKGRLRKGMAREEWRFHTWDFWVHYRH